MLETGGTDPKNYEWKRVGDQVLCFDKDTDILIFSCRTPTTMREALLLGYLAGWEYGDTVNSNYVELLEGLCQDMLPVGIPFDEAGLEVLVSQSEGEPEP